MVILYPACPVCGQDVRNPRWAEGVGKHKLRIAYEHNMKQRFVGRRDLEIGERSIYGAVAVAQVAENGKCTYRSAERELAPPGWIEKLEYAMKRAAEALGWKLVKIEEE